MLDFLNTPESVIVNNNCVLVAMLILGYHTLRFVWYWLRVGYSDAAGGDYELSLKQQWPWWAGTGATITILLINPMTSLVAMIGCFLFSLYLSMVLIMPVMLIGESAARIVSIVRGLKSFLEDFFTSRAEAPAGTSNPVTTGSAS